MGVAIHGIGAVRDREPTNRKDNKKVKTEPFCSLCGSRKGVESDSCVILYGGHEDGWSFSQNT